MTVSTTMTRPFTPTEQRIMDVLADGRLHASDDLHQCLSDNSEPLEGMLTSLPVHLSNMRKILRPRGEDICCYRDDGKTYYYLGRLMAPPSRE